MAGPCTGVSGIGSTETYMKTVLSYPQDGLCQYLHADAWDGGPDSLTLRRLTSNGFGHRQRVLNVLSNSLCSSVQHTKRDFLV